MTTPVSGAGAASGRSNSIDITKLSPELQSAFGTMKSAKSGGNELGQDAFMKLLVAQLRYQDPLNPAQGTEFLAQTAQFTMVEKLTSLEKQNAEAFSIQKSLQAAGLVGRTVTYTNAEGKSVTGAVSSVKFDQRGPMLRVGTEDVPLYSVSEVTTTPSGTTGPSTGTSTDEKAPSTP